MCKIVGGTQFRVILTTWKNVQFLSGSYPFLLTVKYGYDVKNLFSIWTISDKKPLTLYMCNAVQTYIITTVQIWC